MNFSFLNTHSERYCDSVDGHYLIAPHPEYQNLIVATGDSGHGAKMLPILGYKICDVIDGVDTEYTRAWAWRDMGGDAKDGAFDNLRASMANQEQLQLNTEDSQTRMATLEELQANQPRL